MKKLLLVFTLYSISLANVQSQWFNPSLSLNGCLTANAFQGEIKAGIFEASNRKFNLGFEATNEMAIKKDFYLRMGIKYQSFHTTVSGLNQIVVLHDKPDPFIWTKGFNSLTVPLLFGKNFCCQKDRMAKVYFGGSVGLFSNSYLKMESHKALIRNISNQDLIYGEGSDTIGLLKPQFLSTLELGACYQPFKKIERLLLGINLSYQLNWVNVGSFYGKTENVTQGLSFLYESSFQQRSIHIGVSLHYYFKKRQKHS